jgi:flagellar protein FlaJ
MEKKEATETRGSNPYIRISNYFFYNLSSRLFEQGYFKNVRANLISAGVPIFSRSYMSMTFFSACLAAVLGILFSFFLLVTGFDFLVLLRNIGISFALGAVVFFALYNYPATEKKSLSNKIDEELPFISLHMSSIAGSGLEPSKIFEVVISDKESPTVRKEFKKLINQINIYGYDILTALKNVAKETPSKKLSELLNGMATTVSEGGDLAEFLKKRSETLFFDYKLVREKYTKLAETFMNIYISIVIMAPMIFSLLIILIGVSGFGGGLDPAVLTLILILGIGFINVVFLMVLHMRQPSY